MKCIRRTFSSAVVAIILFIAFCAEAQKPPPMTKERQASLTSEQALQMLKDGNQHFVQGLMQHRDYLGKLGRTSSGQYPFAIVLACVDSRQPAEILFDQGLGDIFVARVAGNVLNDDMLGSMEFATKVAGAKLIAVIGHTNCGAVKGAVDDVELGHLTGLLSKIRSAVDEVEHEEGKQTSKNLDFVDKVAAVNVRHVTQEIRSRSRVLRDLMDSGNLKIVGGMSDLSTGKVTFFE